MAGDWVRQGPGSHGAKGLCQEKALATGYLVSDNTVSQYCFHDIMYYIHVVSTVIGAVPREGTGHWLPSEHNYSIVQSMIIILTYIKGYLVGIICFMI
jgi:hypothetical protein